MRADSHTHRSSRRIFEFLKKIRIVPTELREAELFVCGLTFLLLLVSIRRRLLQDLISAALLDLNSTASRKGGLVFSIIMLIVGSIVAIYVALTRQPEGKFVTYSTRFFFVGVNAALSIAIGVHTPDNPILAIYVLSAWQFLQVAALVLFTGQKNLGDFYDMPQQQARRNEILLDLVIVVGGVALGGFYGWYWVATYSGILLAWRVAYSFITDTLNKGSFLMDSPVMGKPRAPGARPSNWSFM